MDEQDGLLEGIIDPCHFKEDEDVTVSTIIDDFPGGRFSAMFQTKTRMKSSDERQFEGQRVKTRANHEMK